MRIVKALQFSWKHCLLINLPCWFYLSRVKSSEGQRRNIASIVSCSCRNSGFDIELVAAVSAAVTIPVIASSGAGCPEHFSEVFARTRASAALAAGIFHRREVPIAAVKAHMSAAGIPTRI